MSIRTKVLVTGGLGFIGSHIVDKLLENNYEVAVLDYDINKNAPDKVKVFNVDIRDFKAVNKAIKSFEPSFVNHHAAQISVSASIRDPEFDAAHNILGSVNVIKACVDSEVKHLIFASTGGALYGEVNKIPADETTPILPVSPYGSSKAAVETYLGFYRRVYGFKSTSLRYSNVYGPRQSPHGEAGVIAIFIAQILNDKAPVIFGAGEDTRDYVYVDDVVTANMLAMNLQLQGSYNIGTGIETSTNSLANLIARETDFSEAFNYASPRVGDVAKISLDALNFSEISGWKPVVKLQEGIKLTVADFKNSFETVQ